MNHCCNPFDIALHNIRKGLRPINDSMIKKLPKLINIKAMVCDSCRKKIMKLDDVNRKFFFIFIL